MYLRTFKLYSHLHSTLLVYLDTYRSCWERRAKVVLRTMPLSPPSPWLWKTITDQHAPVPWPRWKNRSRYATLRSKFAQELSLWTRILMITSSKMNRQALLANNNRILHPVIIVMIPIHLNFPSFPSFPCLYPGVGFREDNIFR